MKGFLFVQKFIGKKSSFVEAVTLGNGEPRLRLPQWALREVCTMTQIFASVALTLGLLTSGAAPLACADGAQRDRLPEPKADPGLVVTLQTPAEMKYTDVVRILDKLKALKVTQTFLCKPEAGKGLSAEVVADPAIPAKAVSAVVEGLLELRVKKIVVEVKK